MHVYAYALRRRLEFRDVGSFLHLPPPPTPAPPPLPSLLFHGVANGLPAWRVHVRPEFFEFVSERRAVQSDETKPQTREKARERERERDPLGRAPPTM